MSETVVWIHADCLSPQHPSLLKHKDAPAVFVFDDVVLDGYGVTLKRLQFIYECLLELPVAIRRGDVAAEVAAFAAESGATAVSTSSTPAPRFHAIVSDLRQCLTLELLHEPPFVPLPDDIDLKRFSRYWRRAERHAFEDAGQLRIVP